MAITLGIDVGSTTVKLCLLDGEKRLYSSYSRHFSRVRECLLEELGKAAKFAQEVQPCLTGSAGLGLAQRAGLPFVQEVQAAYGAIRKLYPSADVAVELGGEDAKIIFLTGGVEQRMNGSCAGGTGAFIDQMATLLGISVDEMDELSLQAEKVYPIASRCGVFAKSDIQPLLNQGASKSDIAASIFRAVVDQTVTGLAQGRKIAGQVLFLGGPLFFLRGLRKAFRETLHLNDETAIFPDDAPVFMSLGAAMHAETSAAMPMSELIARIGRVETGEIAVGQPLFSSRREYDEFIARHMRSDLRFENIYSYRGDAYLGVDAGSTTTKLLLITPDNKILFSHYQTNNGQPLEIVAGKLRELYSLMGDRIVIRGACATGYGEEMLKAALKLDFGIVETMAHFKAALHFDPAVDFIIDIGGQDIKCFKVKNRAVDSIMLNEACSSGCGSFIQTFAAAMGMGIEEFSRLGLFAAHPVELGSRCTVFMNSSVKQAQKEGASVEDISAGLSSSIVKNAIYKVIRARTPDELGEHIVVQGGTFLNDAVLRSFEKETGKEVVRPAIAGLMGAFGAALYAKENTPPETLISSVATEAELERFAYSAKSVNCRGCTSHCAVNILTFSDGRRFVSGNKCERGAGLKVVKEPLDLYKFKYETLLSLPQRKGGVRVGIPLQLVMYEQLPLWTGFFETCGFEVVLSDRSSRELYFKGQHTVASDTACYPAKLMHGHIESLLDKGVDFIFYPCESYNLDEHDSVNHYNCPVVAYYPELLKANNDRLTDDNLVMPYLDPNDLPSAARALRRALKKYRIPAGVVKAGLREGMRRMREYHESVVAEGARIMREARAAGKRIVVLAGRPYHADPEINHGIDKLLCSLGLAVVSEDAVFEAGDLVNVNVLNQWTYHARLYRAAEYCSRTDDASLVQLVSFGCGIDAITTDEVRAILESRGKLYTQIKIDEINNLGVVKIRLRSMLAAVEELHRRGA